MERGPARRDIVLRRATRRRAASRAGGMGFAWWPFALRAIVGGLGSLVSSARRRHGAGMVVAVLALAVASAALLTRLPAVITAVQSLLA